MNQNKEINEFMRHIILYAKHWYPRSSYQINDIRVICAHIAAMDFREYRTEDVWEWVAETFWEYANQNTQKDFLRRLFRPFGEMHFQDMAYFTTVFDNVLGHIGNITVAGNPQLEGLLGTIDPEIEKKLVEINHAVPRKKD